MINNPHAKIFVAGHDGMVGSAINRKLKKFGCKNIITKSSDELDLRNQEKVDAFFQDQQFDEVYLAAAKVGGIHANNQYPADFIYDNLMIQTNVINASFKNNVRKLLFLGSSCIYPKYAPQPMKEEYLLTGAIEPTNEPYAIAKISGIKMCESYNRQYSESHNIDFRSVMPTNLYGVKDNFHPTDGHVIPGLIRRFHEAKLCNADSVNVFGSGNVLREFLNVEDMAEASILIMNLEKKTYVDLTEPMCSHINIGSGQEITIKELAKIVKRIVGFKGKLQFDSSRPDGSPRKLLDTEKTELLNWKPKISLEDGIKDSYDYFMESILGGVSNFDKSNF